MRLKNVNAAIAKAFKIYRKDGGKLNMKKWMKNVDSGKLKLANVGISGERLVSPNYKKILQERKKQFVGFSNEYDNLTELLNLSKTDIYKNINEIIPETANVLEGQYAVRKYASQFDRANESAINEFFENNPWLFFDQENKRQKDLSKIFEFDKIKDVDKTTYVKDRMREYDTNNSVKFEYGFDAEESLKNDKFFEDMYTEKEYIKHQETLKKEAEIRKQKAAEEQLKKSKEAEAKEKERVEAKQEKQEEHEEKAEKHSKEQEQQHEKTKEEFIKQNEKQQEHSKKQEKEKVESTDTIGEAAQKENAKNTAKQQAEGQAKRKVEEDISRTGKEAAEKAAKEGGEKLEKSSIRKIVKKHMGIGGIIGAAMSISDYKDARNQGHGVITSAAKAGMLYALGNAALPITIAKELPSLIVSGVDTLQRTSREMNNATRFQTFGNAEFHDTKQLATMRQAGMELAKMSQYNLQQAIMGNEAQYMHKY